MRSFDYRYALAGLACVLACAACVSGPTDDTASTEQQSVSRCDFVADMEEGSPSAVSRWTTARDDWGAPATHRGGAGATGAGYTIDVREGNAWATLALSEGPRLRAGRYTLTFKDRTSKLDGACASASAQWVEAGLKEGAFSSADANERRFFTRAVVDDFCASCGRFASVPSGLVAELPRGGSLSIALKAGSSGAGGVSATFDDVALECTGGECMTCASGGGGGDPTPPPPDCETRGALRACATSFQVAQELDVREGALGRQRYDVHERRDTRHEAVTLTNDRGVALTFLRSAMGARLVSARARGKELLYQNPTPRLQPNWGQGGFPVFGGVESAWPVEEHGYYGNLAWESRVAWRDDAVSFIATHAGASTDGSPARVTITTTLGAGAESWVQRVVIAGRVGAENMYYTNVMVDAGTKEQPSDLEVIIPGLTRAQVHSRGAAESFLPEGQNATSAEFTWPVHAGRDVSHINTTVRDWLGLFVAGGTPRAQRYGYFDHHRGQGIAIIATDGAGFHPKFFCGRGITADASGSGKAYCEMWFSPNARTFWDHPTLAAAETVHEVRLAPFFERSAVF
jgi:hypothetical protein